jgi:large conductance mechanosensitive channel
MKGGMFMVVQKSIGLVKEFKDFLKEYKVIGLAIAVIMGFAANTLVKSLVDNVVMPIITPFIPGGGWQTAVWNIGKVAMGWGPFLSALIYFIIIALVIFFIAKFVLKEDKVSKK